MKKMYTNFEDVDRDLEILKLEREIQLRKIGLHLEDSTSILSPSNLFKNGLSNVTSTLKSGSGLKSIIISFVVRMILKKFKLRK